MGEQEHGILREDFTKLEERVGKLEQSQASLTTRVTNIEKILDKIDSNTTWILRLIIGAFITSVIGFLIANKGGF
ncbi:hemolysin XhlA family protein [Pullulanibacillus sp. KACC 23026]|uniref:hemolysin XhlA family protein n=1 Tax=Pullulanibacillus sp. KACC 23026 TaxID=3028315 RepID=UPI0023AF5468|nr:hemolysin XhlA family protein [Pullulanibacillus sp. KACC 23026]WEG14013.1 hemolysin XhlA family protein [Pullulanibacillus sp. KACC 23026]